ncbi:amidase signature enzyme [Cristinia sonorae]|uniref:Amidase signature enzyme n=1 Tax=Cristinia sonorae TaxID=1940300 RepID=A0A8K0XNR9_9AGAR|nr:amidase signature enzyme [Cristinia sonorae]
MFASGTAHSAACARKKQNIVDAVRILTKACGNEDDAHVLELCLPQLVAEVNSGTLTPDAVATAYGKRCVAAHEATNCLADAFLDEGLSHVSPGKPLSAVPVSLKDVVDIEGHDTTMGYSVYANRPVPTSAPIVKLLQDAGALLHVKTTVPTGLLSFETESDLFGVTTNPYNPKFSPGGSTGGGAALLAFQGSMVEIATDTGGSVRMPAANCGLYAVKSSAYRFPSYGVASCAPGLETTQTVCSPIARSLEDLSAFWERVVGMKPWEYDHSCVPLPWQPQAVDFIQAKRKPRWGVMYNDGLIPPTPACKRALSLAVDALKKQGHEVRDFKPPNPLDGLRIGYQLVFSDAGKCLLKPLSPKENINGAISSICTIVGLPLFVKRLLASSLRVFSRPAGRNDGWASIVEALHTKTSDEERDLIVQREHYKAAWRQAMKDQGIDFILCPVHALPPVPHKKTAIATLIASNYCFMYNFLDVTAGVVPVTTVNSALDTLPENFQQSDEYLNMNDAARNVWSVYDATSMDGLPLGVQVVGWKLEEEKVLAGMKVLDDALKDTELGFRQKAF